MEEKKQNFAMKKPSFARLYQREKLVGLISNISPEDMFQWSGNIELTDYAATFTPMFDYLNDQSREREPDEPDDDELPFDESFMDDWFIEDENGRREISYPIVTENGEVFWRD